MSMARKSKNKGPSRKGSSAKPSETVSDAPLPLTKRHDEEDQASTLDDDVQKSTGNDLAPDRDRSHSPVNGAETPSQVDGEDVQGVVGTDEPDQEVSSSTNIGHKHPSSESLDLADGGFGERDPIAADLSNGASEEEGAAIFQSLPSGQSERDYDAVELDGNNAARHQPDDELDKASLSNAALETNRSTSPQSDPEHQNPEALHPTPPHPQGDVSEIDSRPEQPSPQYNDPATFAPDGDLSIALGADADEQTHPQSPESVSHAPSSSFIGPPSPEESGDIGKYAEPTVSIADPTIEDNEAGIGNVRADGHLSEGLQDDVIAVESGEPTAPDAGGAELSSSNRSQEVSSEPDQSDTNTVKSASSPSADVIPPSSSTEPSEQAPNGSVQDTHPADAPQDADLKSIGPPPAAPSQSVAAGPSLFSQVISQTRPTHLPPKSREEDQAHMESWKRLMEESKAAEARKAQRAEQRRREREERLEKSLPAWAAVVDEMIRDKAGAIDWRQRCEREERLRLLWEDGVPSHLRGRVWAVTIGNGLAMPKDTFKHYLARAKRAIAENRFPSEAADAINHDRTSALPITKLFVEGSPLADDLGDLLLAWVVSRSEEGLIYHSAVAPLAAMLLVNMDTSTAFIALRNLLERPLLRAFFRDEKGDIEAYYRVLEGLCSEAYPKVFSNCYQLGVRLPESYFTSLFLHQLSLESCAHVWDMLMLDDDGYVFRVILAIIGVLEPRLYFPDRQEIASIFEGHNPATMAIVERERERAKQKGLSYVSETDGVLTDLGVNDSSIFDVLHHDQWKEGRYQRLLERELPD